MKTHNIYTLLNSTLVATSRVLVSIMENFQTKDGHIRIPHVLQKYMGIKKNLVTYPYILDSKVDNNWHVEKVE